MAKLKRNNPGLAIQYTLPAATSGLIDGLDVLESAAANGFIPDVVNIMAMNFYGESLDMGANAIAAMEGTVRQLRRIFPGKSAAQRWAMLGVTVMIGVNDRREEIFRQTDARAVLDHAKKKGVAQISIWSANRDHQCAKGESDLSQCSHIPQAPFAFSKIFQAFTR